MSSFSDHFSGHAENYSAYRPGYPVALFEYLSDQANGHSLAWDCATGNGQAAVRLAGFFECVHATDASEQQIVNAFAHPRVTYRVESAERSSLGDRSADLVTVAQALHWFQFERFHAEVKRVLKPGGLFAAWAYGLMTISPAIDELVGRYYGEVVGRFWPPERRFIEAGYSNIPFPFTEVETPRFEMREEWDLEALAGYLGTWSATRRFIEEEGFDPVGALRERLADLWGEPDSKRTVTWPLHLRVGRGV